MELEGESKHADVESVEEDEETPFVDPEKEDSGAHPSRSPKSVRARMRRPSSAKLWCIAAIVAVAVVALVAAFIVGFLTCHFSEGGGHGSYSEQGQGASSCVSTVLPHFPSPTCTPTPTDSDWGSQVKDGGETVAVVDWLDGALSSDNIREDLRLLSEKPHIAGGDRNRDLAFMLYQKWQEYNFDEVQLYNYTVLLSYPNLTNPNVLQVRNTNGTVLYDGNIALEPPLTLEENVSTVVPPFNAYSGVGNATGSLVYVNYARVDDFFYLTRTLGLNLTGYICIARYGQIFRGNKAYLAERFGCVALIIFSDPADYAPKDGPPVYPDGPALPPGGVQRGSVMLEPLGDPLTPGMPALDGIYRKTYQDAVNDEILVSIPVQPISYSVAFHLMSQLSMFEVPVDWVGELDLKYYILQEDDDTNSTYIEVNNVQEERIIYDVTATIYGRQQPDQMVILGNHRDAWVFGAVDASSGTAMQMELARVLGDLISRDWRPGRTIVLCSWDAEEYGLIGSTEWVEDLGKLLDAQTVAYLNVDAGLSGSVAPIIQASPLLYQAIYQATKLVKSPNPEFKTVYDQWIHYHNTTYNGTAVPLIQDLASGSDYSAFLQTYGISCSSIQYANRKSYDVYHSVHDNFDWISRFADPTFSYHLAMALVWSDLAIALSTTPLLPFDPRDYAGAMNRIYKNLEEEYGELLEAQNISLVYLQSAVQDFDESCSSLFGEIEDFLGSTVAVDVNLVHIVNNKLLNLERSFIHSEGLPGRPWYKHVVFAPSSFNAYGSSVFPGVVDTIFEAVNYGGSWDEVRRQLDIVRVHIHHAIQVLSYPSLKYVART